eukprot:3520694-Rhodomonas_salina.1
MPSAGRIMDTDVTLRELDSSSSESCAWLFEAKVRSPKSMKSVGSGGGRSFFLLEVIVIFLVRGRKFGKGQSPSFA